MDKLAGFVLRNKKFFIFLVVLLIFFIIAFGFLFVAIKFNYLKIELSEKEKYFKELFEVQKSLIGNVEKDLKKIKLESDQSSIKIFEELINIKKELGLNIKGLQDKLSEERVKAAVIEAERKSYELISKQKIFELEKNISNIISYDLADIVNKWRPKIASVSCYFADSTQDGSGIAMNFILFGESILTNKHVLVNDLGKSPDYCNVKLTGYSNNFTVLTKDISLSAKGYDWGIIKIINLDQNLTNVSGTNYSLCEKSDTAIGDAIIILGYPIIGATGDVTVTEGIISGYDEDYYITSAKVDRGNSGGAAVLLKKNCLLGIPSWAKLGSVESLARILNIQTVIN